VKLTVSRNNVNILHYESPQLKLTDKYEVFIGRSLDCHVFLDDQLVSRHHAVLKFQNGTWTLLKLSSFGGLIMNGINVDQSDLHLGDVITIYDFVIKIDELGQIESSAKPIEKVAKTVEVATPAEADQTEEFNTLSESSQEEIPDDQLVSDGDFNSESSDDFSGDASGADAGDGFEETKEEGSTRVLSNFANFELIISGEFAPYDRYTIEESEIFVGRDSDKCQIALDDPEVSSIHAKIKKTLISCSIEDLNSSNGTIVNGNRINKVDLNNGDEIIIGSTVFKLQVKSDLLEAEQDILMPVDSNQEIEVEEVIEEEFEDDGNTDFGDFGESEVEEKSIFKNPKKRKMLIYAVAGLALAWLLLDEEKKPEPKKTDKTEVTTTTQPVEDKSKTQKPKVQLDETTKRYVEARYQQAKKYLADSKFSEAITELNEVMKYDPDYANGTVETLLSQAKTYLAQIEKSRKEADEKLRKADRQKKIDNLLKEARSAVTKREHLVAEALFGDILKLDPENLEVPRLKMEIDAWLKQEEEKKLEIARAKAVRTAMEEKLKPGRNAYLKEDWHKAIFLLTKFLDEKSMDRDLVEEASKMIIEAKRALEDRLAPLLGKARSLKEGQDLKGAYEAYLSVLQVEPANEEALIELENIKLALENRSKKLFREALIDESLSLFKSAKEKFQEVQQISPSDSEYYRKATDKLKNYLE
jgi:pSer/pThr/pTyr-binding forkhead associated (FHA) protein